MTFLAADSRPARVADQLLDLLLLGVLLAAPLVFYSGGQDVFEFNKITILRLLSSGAAVLLLFKLLFVRPWTLLRGPLDLPLLGWLAVLLVCTFQTINPRLSLHGVYQDFEGITTWAMYLLLYWWTLQQVRSERHIRLVLGAVVLAGSVAGFYGLMQNFGLDFVAWRAGSYDSNRMFSTMGNPNFLAAYMVMSMPITFAVFLALPSRRPLPRGPGALLAGLGLLCSLLVLWLFREAYFQAPAAGLSFGYLFPRSLALLPALFGALLYAGRLRWVLLLSFAGQLVSTLFTKSRGGFMAMVAILLLFGGTLLFEAFGLGGLLAVLALLLGLAGLFVSGAWEPLLRLGFAEGPLQSLLGLLIFAGALLLLRQLIRRHSRSALLSQGVDYILGLLLLVWALLFIPPIRQATYELLERVSKLFHPSQVSPTPRLFIWKSSLAILRDHFFFGTGLDTFQISFPPYREALYWSLEWNGTPEKAHNFVFQTAGTMGFLGLLAFAWMHAAWVASSFRLWRRQADERRRLLLLGAFAAWLGFFVQNLFSFTVVGYGSLWWVLWGLLPAMQISWERGAAPAPAAPAAALAPRPAWSFGLGLIALALLACAAGGPRFFANRDPAALALQAGLALSGLACLAFVLARGPRAQPGPAAWVLLLAAGLGAASFGLHSVRIWVADSFYKQGQAADQMGVPEYGTLAYRYASGWFKPEGLNEKLAAIYQVQLPPPEQRLVPEPALNPDQELYWVRMGLAYENWAAKATDSKQKSDLLTTALALHHYTVQMNPINGYNYNNKGRVLRAMGETFKNQDLLDRSLQHLDKAISLDPNNVYFNLDRGTLLLQLGRYQDGLQLFQALARKFPDFAVPYSYIGFILLQAKQEKPAVEALAMAMRSNWRGETQRRAAAALSLAQLYAKGGRQAEAEKLLRESQGPGPGSADLALELAKLLAGSGRKSEAAAVLLKALAENPSEPRLLARLKQLGVAAPALPPPGTLPAGVAP